VAAAQALAYVGLPEAAFHLSHATLFLALSPKSNSVGTAMEAARDLVRNGPAATVPPHLRGAGYPGAERLGHGAGYRYAHDFEGHIVGQRYFPDEIEPRPLYRAGEEGFESELARRLERIDQILGRDRP
jgi:putative ATPase